MNYPGRKEGISVPRSEEERIGEVAEPPVISGEKEARQEAPQVAPPSEVAPAPSVSPPVETPVTPEKGTTAPAATLSLEDVSDTETKDSNAGSQLTRELNAGLEQGPEAGNKQE